MYVLKTLVHNMHVETMDSGYQNDGKLLRSTQKAQQEAKVIQLMTGRGSGDNRLWTET